MPNGSHSNLFVFHQAISEQGRLWCGVTENHSWETDAPVPNTGLTASPAAVEFNGQVYCFHQGLPPTGHYITIYIMEYFGKATGMSEGPSVVADNGRLYCFHQGSGDDGQLWYNVLNGGAWAGDAQFPNTGMSKSPSAVVFNGQIYCFHQGSGENGQLWYNIFDLNRGWLGDTQVPNTGISESPGAVVFNGQLYCFHQGANQNGQLWYNIFDGHNWLGDRLVPGSGLSKSPNAAVLDGMLYCFYQGAFQNGGLYYNIFNGNQWLGQAQVPDTGMSESPGSCTPICSRCRGWSSPPIRARRGLRRLTAGARPCAGGPTNMAASPASLAPRCWPICSSAPAMSWPAGRA